MKTTLALLALLFGVVVAPPAASAEVEIPTVRWLLDFFAAHATPLPKCATEHCTAEEQANRDDVMAVRLEIARAASGVAYDTSEAPLFRGKYGRAMTALRLASIDVHETGLQPKFVRSCHADRGGEACGVGQVHPGAFGLRLVDGKILLCPSEGEDCFKGPDLLEDAVLMQRMMLHILRTGGLGLYTGEGSVEGEASLTIREWEAGWYRSHPAPATDIDVLEMIGEDD